MCCEEQTMVLTDDGRRYHAPTRLWEVADKVNPIGYEGEENTENKLLNPFGEYVVAFAANHNLPISKAYEQLMVKARLAFFQETGYFHRPDIFTLSMPSQLYFWERCLSLSNGTQRSFYLL